jgi:hypothetical protein
MRMLVCGMVLVTATGCAKTDRFARGADTHMRLALLATAIVAAALAKPDDVDARGRRGWERGNGRSRSSTRAAAAPERMARGRQPL